MLMVENKVRAANGFPVLNESEAGMDGRAPEAASGEA